jgi:hypothetical protein
LRSMSKITKTGKRDCIGQTQAVNGRKVFLGLYSSSWTVAIGTWLCHAPGPIERRMLS